MAERKGKGAEAEAKARATDAIRTAQRATVLAKLAEIPLYWMAAAAAKIHPDTLAAWRRDDPEFDLDCRAARAEACEPWVKRISSCDDKLSTTAARYLEKVAPAEFRRDSFVDDQVGQSKRPARILVEVVRSPAIVD
ncbi:MAG: hypothetical protein V3S01_09610 [Dehalococcoidia bacterium]